jgi:hypothetical protein
MVEGTEVLVNNGETFNIVIGAGGAGSPIYYSGTQGSGSSFGSIIAGGGGGGMAGYPPLSIVYGTNGGSGGGSYSSGNIPTGTGRAGVGGGVGSCSLNFRADVFNKHTQISTFASPGGNTAALGSATSGGGAGGAASGRSNSITGSPVTYATGGVGGGLSAGTANTGEGGGGGTRATPTSGAGGSGVCIIRWPTAYPDASSVSGNTPTPAQPGYYVYRWNGDGSITF